jgi:uncharacterized spore protein YtfJ
MPGVDAIKAAFDERLCALLSRNIVGEPIEIEDQIIIPIVKMGMGFGASAGGTDQDASEEGRAGGFSGGGVGVFPVAVVILSKGVAGPRGVKVVPL